MFVPASDTVEVELATPSTFTMMVTPCLLEDVGPGTGSVAGWVGDGATGMSLPGAHVVLSWMPEGAARPQRLEVQTDAGGWYRTCVAPSGIPISATATFFGRTGLRRELAVEEGGAVEAAFLVWDLDDAKVDGRIVDAVTGEGVADAEVWLRGTELRSVTGSGQATLP